MRGFFVFDIHERFPRAGHTERVAIGLDKTIYKIDFALGVSRPNNRVFVESLEVSGGVEIYKRCNCFALGVVESDSLGFFEPIHNLLDGIAVEAADFIHILHNLSITFHNLCIETIGNGCGVIGILHCFIECLHFGLIHSVVEIVGTCEDEVGIGSLINTLGKHCRVENHRIDFCEKCIHFLFFAKRKVFLGECLYSLGEELLGETGSELVHAVVVV